MSALSVSCIIPVYNGERYLAEAIDSILAQTYPVHEIILVDDGSTDDTAKVVSRYAGKVVYVRQDREEQGAARNRGIQMAGGDLIAFLDADDLWHPEKTARQVARFAARPELSYCFTLMKNFWVPELAEEVKQLRDKNLVRSSTPYSPCSVMIRKAVFDVVGMFDEELSFSEDTDLFVRMKRQGLAHEVLPQILVNRRLHENNITRGRQIVSKYSMLRMAMNARARDKDPQRIEIAEKKRRPSAKPAGKQEQFFEEVADSFSRAERGAREPVERYYDIAGQLVCLRFAGPSLAPRVTPALAHLAIPPDLDAPITICLWDSATTGVAMPPFPREPGAFTYRGDMVNFKKGPIRAAYTRSPDIMSLMNTDDGRAIFWIRDAANFPYYETGSPLKTILHWQMARQDCQLLHAAAVGTASGCVLLAGPGGTGKSTTALACLDAGMDYLSDDYCLVKTDPVPTAFSVFSSGKINAEDVDRFPRLGPMIWNKGRLESEKMLFMLLDGYREKIVNHRPIRAVLIPRVTGNKKTVLKKTSRMEAFNALTVSTVFQLPGAGQDDLERIGRLVKQVPVYQIELGTDLAAVPKVIQGLLNEPETADKFA